MQIKQFTYFYPEKPRLTSIKSPMFKKLSDDKRWVAEKKFNGSRLQLHVLPIENGFREFQFWDRHGKTLQYHPSKTIEEALEEIQWPEGYCLLDGELRHNKVPGVKHQIVFYDLFICDGELLQTSFLERRWMLSELIPSGDNTQTISLSGWRETDFPAMFEEVTQDPEIEGLVMKNLNGMLHLGRNSDCESGWMWKVRKESGRYRF